MILKLWLFCLLLIEVHLDCLVRVALREPNIHRVVDLALRPCVMSEAHQTSRENTFPLYYNLAVFDMFRRSCFSVSEQTKIKEAGLRHLRKSAMSNKTREELARHNSSIVAI